VPLYALILSRSAESHRARIIACNNILNAGFMVLAAGAGHRVVRRRLLDPAAVHPRGVLNALVRPTSTRWCPNS
jgi:hypothetical protein